MYNFYDIYSSLEELYNSFFRGNELEFVYNDKKYYILPCYGINETVVGVCIGESGMNENTCFSHTELSNYRIEKVKFGDILSDIRIIWFNF